MEVKEVKADDAGGDVIIEGFASTPDLDRYRDVVKPKAFEEALEMYMKNPVILYQHDGNKPVGLATSAKITGKGLWIRASVKDEDTKTKVLDGRMRALSIGYIALDSALEHEDGTPFNTEKDSYWDPTLVRVIKKLDLVEISIVSTPANGNALFTVAKSVKSFFNDLVTKSFSMNTKEVRPNEVDADEVTPSVDTGSQEGSEEAEELAPPVETEAPAEKSVEGEEAEAKEPTNGQKPPEEDEKGDENAPADSAEAQEGEEAKAESKPEATEEEKTFVVSQLVARALPELVQSGVLVAAKEAGKGVDLPKEIVGVLRKLCDEVVSQASRADVLQAKIDAIPQKSVLPVVGQYENPLPEAPAKKQTASQGFLDLLNKAS